MAGYNQTERAMAHVGATGTVVVPGSILQIATGLVARKRAVDVLYVVKVLDPIDLAAEWLQR